MEEQARISVQFFQKNSAHLGAQREKINAHGQNCAEKKCTEGQKTAQNRAKTAQKCTKSAQHCTVLHSKSKYLFNYLFIYIYILYKYINIINIIYTLLCSK